VRLYRYTDTESDEPRAETTIDVTFAVDGIPAEGVSERTVFLKTEDVGAPRGQSDPLPMIDGRPAKFHAGTWALGARIDCHSSPRDGEVCVPGGAFWMGNPLEARRSDQSGMQRLAVLSPYYISASEVTVAAYRRAGLPATPWGGNTDGKSRDDYCTFTKVPGDFENYPINCVAFASAREYCRKLGGDLPTEAQYEYVAGALRSAPFVWGSEPPTCEGVVMCQQGPFGDVPGDATCRELGTRGGPKAVGSGSDDRFALPTGIVIDLIGNVSEFMRDQWARLVEPCWSRPGLYVNPVCTQAGSLDPKPAFSLRGGEWEGTPNRAAGRFYTLRGSETLGPIFTGFRCVREAP
jgi:formylglycine-generating enzyme required for sulfatase activity